jgi:hypothetical protein
VTDFLSQKNTSVTVGSGEHVEVEVGDEDSLVEQRDDHGT